MAARRAARAVARGPGGRRSRLTGQWFMELATSDPEPAQTFYAHVLGRTYTDAGGGVTIHGPDGELGRIRKGEAQSVDNTDRLRVGGRRARV
jgi:hypothetical protein